MIIPKPKHYEENGTIEVAAAIFSDEALAFCEKAFIRIVKKIHGVRLAKAEDGIKLRFDPSIPENAYRIRGAEVFASSVEGASYGLATMLQLMEKTDGGFRLSDTVIDDAPDKAFRAFMVDLAREWHDFDVLLGYVDLCYLNKIHYLQIHFTDSQSITYPFRAFPDAATKGRCYTRSEIEFLVEYAHEASVELVPEYEGIGHSVELIKNCPEAFGNDYTEAVADEAALSALADANGTITDSIMCIGRPEIFKNIRDMLADYAETFRYSKYIHVGCDEAKHRNWAHCSRCRAYMERQGMNDTKQLYSHFVQKIVDICLSLGRTPIVWEGFPYEGTENISRDAIVVSWESYYQTAPELLSSGFSIINAAWKPMYIVPPKHTQAQWYVSEENWNVYNWQHFMKMSRAYDPINVEPTDRVLGGMLCQWECTPEEEWHKVLENLPATADRTWNAEGFYSHEELTGIKQKLLAMEEAVY